MATPTGSSGSSGWDLASGDADAWERALRAVHPVAIVALIDMWMSPALRQRMNAEDLWQETLLQAWNDRERFQWQGTRSFRRWLVEIARNRIHDAADHEGTLRRGGGVIVLSIEAEEGAPGRSPGTGPREPSGGITPSRSAVLREQAAALRQAMEELPVEYREIVRLRHLEGLTMPEVARRVGLSLAVVRHRFRAGSTLFAARLAGLLQASSFGGAPTPEVAAD